MVIITMDNAVERLKGECSRYMMEIKAGVFVGTMSSVVRDRLWNTIVESGDAGGAVMVFSAPTEQGFLIRTVGDPDRAVVDIDGLFLIKRSK